MSSYPIADFLIQIKNAYLAKKTEVTVPYSKVKEKIALVLSKDGFIGQVKVDKKAKVANSLQINLLYHGKRAKITDIELVSKPGRRVYQSVGKVPRVLGGLGRVIISTPKGIMDDKESKKLRLGGEIICKIW